MSRSFGGSRSRPGRRWDRPVGSPRAGDHPQRCRLAAARRADEDEELAVPDVERGVLPRRARHRHRPCRLPSAERQPSILSSVVTRFAKRERRARPLVSMGSSPSICVSSPMSVSELRATERSARKSHRHMVGARGEAEHRLVAGLAQVHDRVEPRHARSGCRRARAPGSVVAARSAPRCRRARPTYEVLGRGPRHRPPRVLAPVAARGRSRRRRRSSARRASSSAARRRRAVAPGDRRALRKRITSWLSRIAHEWRDADHGIPCAKP